MTAVPWDVVGLLGRGGCGVVELAVAPDGTRVARKRVTLGGSAEAIAEARRRLRREAEVLSALRHPAIVPVLAVEDDHDGLVLVLPAYEASLADRAPLPPAAVAALGTRLLGALAAAHAAGVVHRDVKPANVLLDAAGAGALADFGAAAGGGLTAGLTAEGGTIGTPMWMAPEQARGEAVGPAADIWALGATLRFAATGRPPHPDGPPSVLLARAAAGRRLDLGGLPAWLAGPLAAMLHPDPAARPTAADLLAGDRGATVTLPGHRAAGRPRRGRGRGHALRSPLPASRPGRTGRLAGAVAVAAAAAAGLGVGVALAIPGHPTRAAATAPAPTTACAPLLYQPCGGPAAPHTDGTSCLPGWWDLDGSAADGCEATSDWRPGTALAAGATVRADVVPASATDTFTTRVDGHLTSLCSGALHLVLTAPAGAADRLVVRHGGALVAAATSAGGVPATATIGKPGCWGSHSETLDLAVTEVAGTSGADFTLTRSGGW